MRFSVRPVRILTLLLLVAVTNVFVFANGAVASSTKDGNEASGAKVLLGKLVTTSNRPIMVNGGEAITGSVILSGAQLTTPAASFAAVRIDNLGSVLIAANSSVALAFDSTSITVNIARGDASLTTAAGVKGTVVGPDGKVVPGNSAGGNNAPTPAVSHPEAWGIAGVAIGSAALIWAIIAHNRANTAEDDAAAANAAAASLAAQLAALRTCLAGQTTSPVKLCTSF